MSKGCAINVCVGPILNFLNPILLASNKRILFTLTGKKQ